MSRVHVLHVDDDREFAGAVADSLEQRDEGFVVETAPSAAEAEERLGNERVDCIVSEYDLPDTNGLEFLKEVRKSHPHLPFILLTGTGSEDVASEAISAGVSDYLQKGSGTEQYEVLADRILNNVERTRTRGGLEGEQTHRGQAQAVARVGRWQLDPETDELCWSDEVYEIFEAPREESLTYDAFLDYVHPDDRAGVDEAWTAALEGAEYDIEHRIVTGSGDIRWVREHADVEFDEDSDPTGAIGVVQDITERNEDTRPDGTDQGFVERAMDAIDDIFYVIGPDGSLVCVNERACEVTGYTEPELLSMDPAAIVSPADRDQVERHIKDAFKSGSATLEANIVTKDGEAIPYEFRKRRLSETDAEATLVGIGRDITERDRRERELRAAKRRFDAVFNNPIAFMALLEPDGTIIEVNETAVEFVGRQPESVTGEPFWETPWWSHSAEVQADLRSWIEQAASGEFVRFEATNRGPDGERVEVDGTINPITDQDGAITALLAAGRDITERKDRERELRRQNERLDEFASVVSHDLRNPLNVAQGRLELVKQDVDHEHLPAIERAHDRMNSLIDELLSLARLGETVSAFEPVDLEAVVGTSWRTVATDEATLVFDGDGTIRADESRLQRMLANFFRNATEHSDGAVTVQVGVLGERDGMYVEDDGPGIPAAERERVFDPGYTTQEGGTGLGLSIVNRIVTAHGWDIRLESGADGGARFEISGVEFVEE